VNAVGYLYQVKSPGCVADQIAPSNAEINAWSYSSTLPKLFLELVVSYMDNSFTFTNLLAFAFAIWLN
jgi:hypothetical protein